MRSAIPDAGAPWTRTRSGDAVVVVVSDLHLPLGGGDPEVDGALARWGEALAAVQAADRRLILLGDTAELMLASGSGGASAGRTGAPSVVRAAIRSVLRAHPATTRALRRLRRSGWSVEVVPGNHDAELAALHRVTGDARSPASPPLGPPRPGPLRLRPWIVREAGWFHAEHGHQLHDVNAFRDPLRPVGQRGRVEPTIGRALTRLAHAGPPPPSLRDRGRALLAVLGAMAWRAASPRPAAQAASVDRLLDEEARQTGLAPGTLRALRAASAYPLRGITSRLLRGALAAALTAGVRPVTRRLLAGGRAGRRGADAVDAPGLTRGRVAAQRPAAYAPRGAARRLAILRDAGEHVPFLVVGHTHALGILPLPGADRAWLVTTGSRLRPPEPSGDEDARDHPPSWPAASVEVPLPVAVLWRERDGSAVGAEVGWWDASGWRSVSRVVERGGRASAV